MDSRRLEITESPNKLESAGLDQVRITGDTSRTLASKVYC